MAELDILGTLIGIGIGVILGGGAGFLLASWTNIFWRAKFMRNSLHREVFIFRMLSKDKRSMKEMIVDVNDDVKVLGDKAFICEKGRVWRTSIENMKLFEDSKKSSKVELKTDEMATLESGNTTSNIHINKDDGFYLEQPENSKKVKWEQEVPVMYIDDESFRPLEITELRTESKVTAEQLGQMLTTFINVSVAKKLSSKKMDMMSIITILGIVGIGFLMFQASGKIDDLKKITVEQGARITVIQEQLDSQGQSDQSPIIIKQMPTTGDGYSVLSSTTT